MLFRSSFHIGNIIGKEVGNMFGTTTTISAIIGGSIAAGIIRIASGYQPKEVRKINHVFENIGYRAGKLLPRLIETRRHSDYIEYIYEVPPGLMDDPKLSER